MPRLARACLSACLALLALDPAALAQTRKVSPPTRFGPSGRVESSLISPDGTAVAYVLYSSTGYSLHVATASGVRMLRDGWAGELAFSADGRTLVFAGPDHDSPLYSAPIDGSAAPLALTPPSLEVTFHRDIVVAPSGWVVFQGVEEGSLANDALYSVRLDGRSLVRLDAPTAPRGGAWWFRVSPDGKSVAYVGDPAASADFELYVVPITGGAPPRKVSAPFVADGYVRDFAFTADSQHLVYRANALRAVSDSLFAAAVAGGPVVRLDAGSTGTVTDFELSPDGELAYFLHDPSGRRELYRAPIKGGAAPERVNAALVTGATVSVFELAPDGSVIYRADQEVRNRHELWHVPNGRAPRRLSAPLDPAHDVGQFQLAPDGARLLYAVAPTRAVYLARLDSAVPAVLLPPGPTGPVAHPFAISASGEHLVFPEVAATPSSYASGGVWALRLDGASAPVELVPGGPEFSVRGILLGLAGERALVLANTGYQNELLAVPIAAPGAPARVNAPLPMDAPLDRVEASELSPDSRYAVFAFGEGYRTHYDLWSADLESGAPALRLATQISSLTVRQWFRVSADSARVVYRSAALEMLSVPIDGSAPPLLLGSGASQPLELTASGHVLWLDAAKRLHAAAIDGSAPPVEFGGFDGIGAVTFLRHGVSADGARVAYHFRGSTSGSAMHLFAAPLDGSAPAVRLDPAQLAQRLHLVTEGGRVVFHTPAGVDSALWSVPLDGGAAPTPLATAHLDTTVEGGVVAVGEEVAFVTLGTLHSVPADGHAAARPIAPGLSVLATTLKASATRLYFTARAAGSSSLDLWSLPRDLTGTPTRVSRSTGYATSSNPVETSDGARVVYQQYGYAPGESALFSAPSDGGREPLRLADPLVEYEWGAEGIGDYQLTRDGRTVLFTRALDDWANKGRFSDLLAVPSTAIAPARQVSLAPRQSRRVPAFHLDPDGRFVLYEGDQELADVDELWLAPLRERPLGKRNR